VSQHEPIHLVLAFLAGGLHAAGSLVFKRAFAEGATTRQAFHVSNLLGAVLYLPLMAFESRPVPWERLWQPAAVGFAIFAGNLTTFAAIRRADVSLITPLLGTKVLFVAAGTVVLAAGAVSSHIWLAAILTTVGVFVLGFREFRTGHHGWGPAMVLVMLTAALFALADVLLQKWAVSFGPWAFVALFAASIPLFTLASLPFETAPVFRFPPRSRPWLLGGSAIYAAQGLLMAIALGFFGDVTRVNIIYSSRGLWAIGLAFLAAPWLGVSDDTTTGALPWRLVGTRLITAAVVIALRPA
jgi:drug/metabolite transporter (DMT)-like permease